MPTNSFLAPVSSRKSLKLTGLFLLFPLFFFGQTLTGLWTGALSNDSTTVRKDQSFEIVLTEYGGKVFGYSRSEFIVDDTLYYVMKRVKGTIEGDVCEVTDDEIISYNFRGKLDKGVKVTSIFRRNKSDSAWYLDGTWKTNATKKYYSVTGKVNLEEEKDLAASKIFPHLEELKLANDIAFYRDRKEGAPIVKLVKPEKIKTEYSTKSNSLPNNTDMAVAPIRAELQRAETKPMAASTEGSGPRLATAAIETVTDNQSTEEVVAVKKVTTDLPKTDTKNIAIAEKPAINLVPVDKTADIIRAETDEQVVAVKKTITDLPKTDTKNITASEKPANNLVPADKTADIIRAETDEQVVAVKKTITDLPKTDTKSIAASEKPAINLVPADKTADMIRAEADEQIVAVKKPAIDLPKSDAKNIPLATVTHSQPAETKTRVENKIPETSATVNKPADPVTNIIAENKQIRNVPDTKTVSGQNPPVTNRQAETKNVTKTTTPDKKQELGVAATTKASPVIATYPAREKKETISAVSVIPDEKKPVVDIIAKAALIGGRKSEFSQIVSFKSDSLELSLYDNGEIDGDTVSIYLNGEVVMSKQGLKASAIKKTIHITPGNEDFTLVLFAENLGKYPPNTGLLVVHDGNDVYNLRFSSDFEKNAGIIFRRNK